MSDRYMTAEETKINVSPECGLICEREYFSYFFFNPYPANVENKVSS